MSGFEHIPPKRLLWTRLGFIQARKRQNFLSYDQFVRAEEAQLSTQLG